MRTAFLFALLALSLPATGSADLRSTCARFFALVHFRSEIKYDYATQGPFQTIEMREGYLRSDRMKKTVYFDSPQSYRLEFGPSNTLRYSDPMKGMPDGTYDYFMDASGNFYAIRLLEEDPLMHFHHSSLPQGGPVAGIGSLQVKDGKLTYINRCSGHYRPTMEIFLQVLEGLIRKGVDIARIGDEVDCH